MKQSKRFLMILFLLIGNLSIYAQLSEVEIYGKADFAANAEIRLLINNDYITYTQHEVTKTIASSTGEFQIKTTLRETTFATLCIGKLRNTIYLEPEKKYHLELYADSAFVHEEQPLSRELYFEYNILNTDSTELNARIANFEMFFDDLMAENLPLIMGNPLLQDSLLQVINQQFPTPSGNEYFDTYMHFATAKIDFLCNPKQKAEFCNQYFKGNEVFYNNTAFIDLFHTLFTRYFYNGNKKLHFSTILKDINDEANYFQLLDDMGKDPVLENEILRELVMLKSLGEVYADEQFNKNNIISILSNFADNTKFATHKQIALNLIAQLQKLAFGQPAPDFKLKDANGNYHALSDFRGKYLYIQFFRTTCVDCIAEMNVIRTLKETFGDSISFIGICLDEQEAKLYHFKNQYKFDWTLLHFGGDYNLIDQYDITALPTNILIDRDGNIVSYPAMKPSEGLMQEFYLKFRPKDNDGHLHGDPNWQPIKRRYE